MNTWSDLSDLSQAAKSKLPFFQIIISKKSKLCPSALCRTKNNRKEDRQDNVVRTTLNLLQGNKTRQWPAVPLVNYSTK